MADTSAIIARPSDPAANSYVSLEEAEQYFADRMAVDAWSDASEDEQAQALLEATRRIDRFRFFNGKYRTSPEQALEFPRSTARSASGTAFSGSATTLIDSALAGLEQYPDDHFNGWAVEMRTGDNEFKLRLVTDFDAATGELTFEEFPAAVASGDEYRLVEAIPKLVRWATLETALWLCAGGEGDDPDPFVKQHSIGKFSETFVDGHGVEVRLPRKAYAYLQKFISRIGTIS